MVLCTAILDSLWSMDYTRILVVLCTAVLDSLWSMDETRILVGSVELFLDSLCSMEYPMGSVQLFYTHSGFGRYKDTYGLCTAILD